MSRIALALVLQALLCALSQAQTPVPPSMVDTFQASGEVEFHGAETTTFGEFVLARDQTKMMGYEKEEYKEGDVRLTETVLRYDMNKTYYLRGSDSRPHCLEEDRKFNGMPKFWSFLDSASYEGTDEVRNIVYDMWGTNIGGVRFEFGKPRTNSSILYFYRRKTTESSTFYSFMEFKMTPDTSVFTIPSECKETKKN